MSKLNVLLQTNDGYAPYAGISMVSLFENNIDIEEIEVFIIDDEISDNNKFKFGQAAEKYHRTIVFLDVSSGVEILKKAGAPTWRNAYTAYLRLFAINLLPDRIDRILYMDADTVVEGNLDAVCTFEMNDNVVCAVKEGLIFSAYKASLGYAEEDAWYNSGVMLIDVTKWKKSDAEGRIVQQLIKQPFYFSPDQDLINITLHEEIGTLPYEYNAIPHFHVFPYNTIVKELPRKNYYSKEEIEAGDRRAIIRHFERFVGEFPWHKGNLHPYNALFDKYMMKSPWNDYVKQSSKAGMMVKIEKILYKVLPKRWFFYVWAVVSKRNFEKVVAEHTNKTT